MTRRARVGISMTFLGFFLLGMGVHSWVGKLFEPWGWQNIAMVLVVASAGAVFSSLILEYTITIPIRAFIAKLQSAWSEKKELPAPVLFESELQEVLGSFKAVLGDSQKKVAALGETQQLDDAKYEFVAIANHQLRTPLTEVRWAMQALGESLVSKDPTSKDLIEKAKNGTERITGIIDQLLAVTELSSTGALARVMVNVGDMIDVAATRLDEALAQHQMNIKIEKDQSVIPTVTADPRLLGFVFDTLLSNAVDYGTEHTPVFVRLRNNADMVAIDVENTGSTLSSEEASLLFEKFFRGEHAKRTRPNGSGLALYLCKRILERMGGTISVRREENRMVFSVTLPLATEEKLRQFVRTY